MEGEVKMGEEKKRWKERAKEKGIRWRGGGEEIRNTSNYYASRFCLLSVLLTLTPAELHWHNSIDLKLFGYTKFIKITLSNNYWRCCVHETFHQENQIEQMFC